MRSYCKGVRVDEALVRSAYDLWLTKPSGKKNGWRVAEEYGDVDTLIGEIVAEVSTRSLRFRPIHRYRHVEPTNGKPRVIGVESVKQQVCDYVAVLAMKPMLDAKIGFYQVAAVEGKGQRLCRGALRKWSGEARHHVKADVRQCYPSISHEVVMRVLRKYVRSADVLYLCEALLATYDRGGLEIGSFFALMMAQLVLSFAYHHIEGLGKRRRGRWVPLVRHQMWHLDDFVLIGNSKSDLKRAIRSVVRYLRDEFGLIVKPWKVAKTSRREPLDLGGWVVRELPRRVRMTDGSVWLDERVTYTKVTVRSGIFLRARRAYARLRKHPSIALARRCCSYWGWLRNSDSDGFIRRKGIHRLLRRASGIVAAYDRRARACSTLATLPA